jgi:transcription-repair coupling factor (superfamily II helicase)
VLTQHLFAQLLDDPQVNQILLQLQSGRRNLVLSGITPSAKPAFLSLLHRLLKQPLLYVGSNHQNWDEFRRSAIFFHRMFSDKGEDRLTVLPALEPSPYSRLSPHPEVLAERALAFWKLFRSELDILLCPSLSLLTRLPDLRASFSSVPEVSVGSEIAPEELVRYLLKAGYVRDEPVASVGTFSVRGGIVDVYSPGFENPLRLEFFGDEIESLREFSVKSQRSIGPVQRAAIVPMRELFIDEEAVRLWGEQAEQTWSRDQYADFFADQVTRAQNGEYFQGCEYFLPLIIPFNRTLLDLAEGFVLVMDEPQDLNSEMTQCAAQNQKEFEALAAAKVPAIQPSSLFIDLSDFGKESMLRRVVCLDQLGTSRTEGSISLSWPTRTVRKYHGDIKEVAADLQGFSDQSVEVVFVQSTLGKAERLYDVLKEYDLPCTTEFSNGQKDGDAFLKRIGRHHPIIVVGDVFEGFEVVGKRFYVLGDRDLFDESDLLARPAKSKQKSASFISDFRELKPGDYVVHVDHGIGQFQGLRQIAADGLGREFMILSYYGDDKVYVPLERLDLIQKYSSAENSHPSLDKLGGTTWIKTKARIKKSMRDMAEELLKLYAERRVVAGFAFSPQGHWHQEFEEAFEYSETTDQLAAIEDVYRDMESEVPMDRLLCGDVGFGKTEVAMRAAFKAAFDGKQVVVLAPTTVLAYQHFIRFRQRFTAFPMNIEMLSRFRGPKEQPEIIARLATGNIDILIGTHRLLSKDVHFRDLGLLIVDEEQQFGVAHKERLKQLKRRVDTLTMTATPIPRTLHMSLLGIRDMSVIETPPRDRLAIQTLVVPFSKQIIEKGMLQELERNGQIYFVHNKVESIYSVASMVQKICPRARIVVGHGQMAEKDLEATMLKFVRHEADILVCTTIIENGLDIPLVNTIIVNRADRFGLAQLYQLRGRVGRSSRPAYAYLLVPPDKVVSGVARQRLAALKEFSDLGSGFKIAALDLELRGAGNLLGGQQHGHINSIGFDLYCQMLERTIEEIRGQELVPEVQSQINLKVSVRIPPQYIPDENQRLSTYKKISSIKADSEIEDLRSELEDRFGPVPSEVESLIDYVRLRLVAERALVQTIERERDAIAIKFHEKTPIAPQRLVEIVSAYPEISVTPSGTLKIQTGGLAAREIFSSVRTLLLELGG